LLAALFDEGIIATHDSSRYMVLCDFVKDRFFSRVASMGYKPFFIEKNCVVVS
jgi:hypothetical protein